MIREREVVVIREQREGAARRAAAESYTFPKESGIEGQ